MCLRLVPSPCPSRPRIFPGRCCYRQEVGGGGGAAGPVPDSEGGHVIWGTDLHRPTRPRLTIATKFSHLRNPPLPLPGRAPSSLT